MSPLLRMISESRRRLHLRLAVHIVQSSPVLARPLSLDLVSHRHP
ncbi:MAG: hypothetical protein ACR2MZ_06555 [Candidatus Dormibacter sp.]